MQACLHQWGLGCSLPQICASSSGTGALGRVEAPRQKGVLSYLNKMVVRAIKVLVQLNDQTLEEGRELPLLFAGLWERNRAGGDGECLSR